jgi:hypothetical protein
MSTFRTPPPIKNQTDTRTLAMDDFKHVLQILDIGLNSELERDLQIVMITSTRHILQMTNEVLDNLEFKKCNKPLPVPRYQIASLCLFIEYCKYRNRAGDPVQDFQLVTQENIDTFTLLAPVTVTALIPRSSAHPPLTSDPAMK